MLRNRLLDVGNERPDEEPAIDRAGASALSGSPGIIDRMAELIVVTGACGHEPDGASAGKLGPIAMLRLTGG